MTEPAVTLTDYALALEAMLFVIRLQPGPRGRRRLRLWLSLFFASAAIASLCGGTVHGFFHDEQTAWHSVLWRATLIASGVAAVSTWGIGAELLVSKRIARAVMFAAIGQFAIYTLAVLLYTQEFWVAIAINLPAVFFLIGVLASTYWWKRNGGALVALAGQALSLLAALLQQLGVGIHQMYFNHNALYHILQMLALYSMFAGVRSIAGWNAGQRAA